MKIQSVDENILNQSNNEIEELATSLWQKIQFQTEL